MKTNQIYIIVAIIVVIILGFVLWNKDKTQEVGDQNVENSNSVGNTNTSNQTGVPNQGSVPTIPTAASLIGSTLRLVSYNGIAVSADSKYSLSFADGSLSAKFCNNVSGNFVLDGSSIKANNLISTKMSCSTPANLMDIETAFISMLDSGGTIYRSGGTIILSHASKGTVMVFSGF